MSPPHAQRNPQPGRPPHSGVKAPGISAVRRGREGVRCLSVTGPPSTDQTHSALTAALCRRFLCPAKDAGSVLYYVVTLISAAGDHSTGIVYCTCLSLDGAGEITVKNRDLISSRPLADNGEHIYENPFACEASRRNSKWMIGLN